MSQLSRAKIPSVCHHTELGFFHMHIDPPLISQTVTILPEVRTRNACVPVQMSLRYILVPVLTVIIKISNQHPKEYNEDLVWIHCE